MGGALTWVGLVLIIGVVNKTTINNNLAAIAIEWSVTSSIIVLLLFSHIQGAGTSNLERLDQLPEHERYNGLTNVGLNLIYVIIIISAFLLVIILSSLATHAMLIQLFKLCIFVNHFVINF